MKLLKWLTPLRTAVAVVAIPVLLAAAYNLMLAQDRFVSESTVALREAGSASSVGAALPGAALLLANLAPPSREDMLLLQAYVRSLAFMKMLDAELDLRGHYSSSRRDVLARLSPNASQEEFLAHYRERVSVSLDEISTTLTVHVQAFDPDYAQKVAQGVLSESERFINEYSHRMAQDRLEFAQGELARAADQLQAARADVLAFQNKHKLLDATAEAQATGVVISELAAQISKAESELRALRAYLNDDSHQIRTLASQIAALRAQLSAERRQAVGGGKGSQRINALSADYQALQMRAEFALDAYKIGLSAVESARLDASRKLKSLIVIEPPTLAETANYPRRVYNIATVLVVCTLLFGAVRLTLATIEEHQD